MKNIKHAKTKRPLSMLLALCFSLSLLPAVFAADEPTQVATGAELQAALNEGQSVVLTADLGTDGGYTQYVVTKEVTIDGNGKTVYGNFLLGSGSAAVAATFKNITVKTAPTAYSGSSNPEFLYAIGGISNNLKLDNATLGVGTSPAAANAIWNGVRIVPTVANPVYTVTNTTFAGVEGPGENANTNFFVANANVEANLFAVRYPGLTAPANAYVSYAAAVELVETISAATGAADYGVNVKVEPYTVNFGEKKFETDNINNIYFSAKALAAIKSATTPADIAAIKFVNSGNNFDVTTSSTTPTTKATTPTTKATTPTTKATTPTTTAVKKDVTVTNAVKGVVAKGDGKGNVVLQKVTKATSKKGYTKKLYNKVTKKYVKAGTKIKQADLQYITIKDVANTYSIVYKLNKGKLAAKVKVAKYTYKKGVTKAAFKKIKPTRSGFVFKGWYSDSKLKKKVTSIGKTSAQKVTLYAKWAKK